MNCNNSAGSREAIPVHYRNKMNIPPLPKNMHPLHHGDRRKGRVEALRSRFEVRKDVLYVAAAEYEARSEQGISEHPTRTRKYTPTAGQE